jgi:hypothetical protein
VNLLAARSCQSTPNTAHVALIIINKTDERKMKIPEINKLGGEFIKSKKAQKQILSELIVYSKANNVSLAQLEFWVRNEFNEVPELLKEALAELRAAYKSTRSQC